MKTKNKQTGKSTIETLREIRDKVSSETQNMTFEQLQKLYNFLKENSFGTYRRREIWLDLSPIQNIKDDTRIPDYIKTYINDFILNNVLSEFILFIETIDVFADNKRKYCGNK